jgi:hypothetical protein
MTKTALLFALFLCAASAAAASVGIQVGQVLAVDREAQVMLLTDRSAWSMADSSADLVNSLNAGDRVEFSYRKPGDGLAQILKIEVKHRASETGATGVAEGTVLAHDRRAKVLVLVEKSTWPLRGLDSEPPPGLGAGDRVRIEYHNDKDGAVTIDDLIVIF